MASVHYSNTKRRWRAVWFIEQGNKRSRYFATEHEAREFAETGITDERPRRTAGRRPWAWTPEQIRARIARSTVVDQNGCWIWQAKGGSHGYAQLMRRVNGRPTAFTVHRLSYEAHVGPIPDGLTIDHLCSVRKCVNPEHLEPVTLVENNRRRDARKAAAL